jgi:hypothetical protein
MIPSLTAAVLALLMAGAMRAFALPITKHIVIGWTRLYTAIASKQGETRRAEVKSDIEEHITFCINARYAPHDIAYQILLRFVMGLPDDLAWCWPFVPAMIVDKTERYSDALRHFRTPKQLIPSLATLGIMNWAFFSSESGGTAATWVGLNGITIAFVVLMWKFQRPWARRIFYSWTGLGVIITMALIGWLTVGHHLYELPIFQVYMLALASVAPAILIVDKAWRARLFKGHWWLIVIFWLLIIGVSLAISWALTGNIALFFIAWATIALLIVSLVLLCVIAALVTATVWYGGIRGTSAGLRLMAAGIRRLR